MSSREFVLSVIQRYEEKFGGIAYGHQQTNESGNFSFWSVSIDNYEIYKSDEFKTFSESIREESRSRGIKVIFMYCQPVESFLVELADSDNLVMNV